MYYIIALIVAIRLAWFLPATRIKPSKFDSIFYIVVDVAILALAIGGLFTIHIKGI